MTAMEMRLIRKIKGTTRRDGIKNTEITTKLKVTPINKIAEERQVTAHLQNGGKQNTKENIWS